MHQKTDLSKNKLVRYSYKYTYTNLTEPYQKRFLLENDLALWSYTFFDKSPFQINMSPLKMKALQLPTVSTLLFQTSMPPSNSQCSKNHIILSNLSPPIKVYL